MHRLIRDDFRRYVRVHGNCSDGRDTMSSSDIFILHFSSVIVAVVLENVTFLTDR